MHSTRLSNSSVLALSEYARTSIGFCSGLYSFARDRAAVHLAAAFKIQILPPQTTVGKFATDRLAVVNKLVRTRFEKKLFRSPLVAEKLEAAQVSELLSGAE